jgi:hypothetical protein
MGAKNLILLSRTGLSSSPVASELVSNLINKGATIAALTCDVCNVTELKKTLEECQRSMPPVKGCINAAMVLEVKSACTLQINLLTCLCTTEYQP